jgi:hypothetical protein
MLLITAAQTGLCWHRLKPAHSKYKKLHRLVLITPSDKQDSTFLPSEIRRRGNTCACGCHYCHYEPNISENIPFPLFRDSNWSVICWRRCLKTRMVILAGRLALVWEKRHLCGLLCENLKERASWEI